MYGMYGWREKRTWGCIRRGVKNEHQERPRPRQGPSVLDIEIMRKYEGFRACYGLRPIICNERGSPCSGSVLLYAKLGLHRYNLLQGKDLKLRRVNQYNESYGGTSYYITLTAEDPAIPGSIQYFQAAVTQFGYGRQLLMNCSIARPLGKTKKDHIKKSPTSRDSLSKLMPELPSENPFKNPNRFYVLKNSELQDNDWIRLYLELAVAKSRSSKIETLTNLKILKVSTIQDLQTPNQWHNVNDATFYIMYKDYCEARVGKESDRIAIVRRILDKKTGNFKLVGRNESSVTIIAKIGLGSNESSITHATSDSQC